MIWIAVPFAVVALGYGPHRLALWADGRGWLYYKTKPRSKGSSLGLIEGIYNSAVEHMIEEKTGERGRGSQDESGGMPGGDEAGSSAEMPRTH